MNTAEINSKLIDSYLTMAKNMHTQTKLDLIKKLSESARTGHDQKQNNFYSAFGGWDEHDSAEEIIRNIRESRNFQRIKDEL